MLGKIANQCFSSAKVWVNKDTRVICQGMTGKEVLNDCNLMLT